MPVRRRLVVAVTSLAVGVGIATAPVLTTTASAETVSASTPSAECAAAQAAEALAAEKKATKKRKVREKRRALRRIQRRDFASPEVDRTKTRKAKRQLRRARRQHRNATAQLAVARSEAAAACFAAPARAEGYDLGALLALLAAASGNGSPTTPPDAGRMLMLLDALVPGLSGELSPDQLTAILGGFAGAGALDPALVTEILGGDPATLLADPAGFAAAAERLVAGLSALGGGTLPLPGLDAGLHDELLAGMFGGLDAGQVGQLLQLVLAGAGAPAAELDAAQLTVLLEQLVPGLAGQLGQSQLDALLAGVNGPADPQQLFALLGGGALGGGFDAAQLGTLLAGGTVDPVLAGTVISQVVAQLGTLGGGALVPPGDLDPAVLTGLVSSLTDVVGDLLGGDVPIVGGILDPVVDPVLDPLVGGACALLLLCP